MIIIRCAIYESFTNRQYFVCSSLQQYLVADRNTKKNPPGLSKGDYNGRIFDEMLLLLVQLQLQDELLLRKIKEQDGFYPMKMIYNSNLNLVMEGLENSSYRCMFSSYRWMYSCNYSCAKLQLYILLLNHFGEEWSKSNIYSCSTLEKMGF